MIPPVLAVHGPALTLRFPAPGDAPALFALGRDPEVTRWFSWRYRAEADAARWIAGREAARAAGEWLEFVVERRGEGIVGVTGLSEPALRDRRVVVGTWFARAAWGTGANAESKALVAHLAFGPCGFERLAAYARPDNERSRRALARLGFVREGRLRSYHRHGDAVHDVDLFSLLRGEWAVSALAAVPARVEGEVPPAFKSR
jgi:ribosomal-protein-alanine N-acetyltransferase